MAKNHEEQEEQDQFEDLIQGLVARQYGYSDNFIHADILTGLRDNLQRISKTEEMKDAGIGNNKNVQKNQSYRGDKIKWLEDNSQDQYEALFLKKIGNFMSHLNKTCYTSINSFECHYAQYERTSYYKRHIDQFKNDKSRKYSIVLYLNEQWNEEDGGLLSLYPKGEEEKTISPVGGRMVFFRSDDMEHEVHPSFTKVRKSIAGWMKS